MSLLNNVKSDASIANEKDSLGAGGALDSDAYMSEITLAYLAKSSGGALSLTVYLKTDSGREHRETLWVTSGDSKGNKNYYEKDGKKEYLPGFNTANSLCLLTVGKELGDMVEEEKIVKIYNSTAKAEVPTPVPVLTALIGQKIIAGLVRQSVDKNVKDAADNYVASGETRDENEVSKFFRAKDKLTTAEIRAKSTEPAFYDSWVAKWKGIVRDKTTKGGSNVKTGAFGKAAGANEKPTESLFN